MTYVFSAVRVRVRRYKARRMIGTKCDSCGRQRKAGRTNKMIRIDHRPPPHNERVRMEGGRVSRRFRRRPRLVRHACGLVCLARLLQRSRDPKRLQIIIGGSGAQLRGDLERYARQVRKAAK